MSTSVYLMVFSSSMYWTLYRVYGFNLVLDPENYLRHFFVYLYKASHIFRLFTELPISFVFLSRASYIFLFLYRASYIFRLFIQSVLYLSSFYTSFPYLSSFYTDRPISFVFLYRASHIFRLFIQSVLYLSSFTERPISFICKSLKQ